MSARELNIGGGHDNRSPDEEIIDIKMLLKVLIESHTNTRNEMMEILRSSTSHSKTDKGKDKVVENPPPPPASSDHQKQKGKNNANSSTGKQEIAQVPGGGDEEYREPSEVDEAIYVPGRNDQLFEALRVDDLDQAKEFLKKNPDAINQAITHDLGTTLHLAVYWDRKTIFVEEIVKLMAPKVLEYKICTNGNTALHTAASRGIIKAAVMMVHKNSKLTQIRNHDGRTPLEYALFFVTSGQKEIVEYLYSVTRDEEPNSPFSGPDGARLICSAIDADFYDLAFCLVKRFPKLVMENSPQHGMCGLELLVRKPFAFPSGTKLTWWQTRIYSLIHVDMNMTYVHPLEPNTRQYSSEFSERDNESPPEYTQAEESFSLTKHTGILMLFLTRVPHLKKSYNHKLMHLQATVLLKQMLVELRNANSTPEIINFFQSKPDIMRIAIKHGIIEFVAECLEQFDYLVWQKIANQTMIQMAIAERNDIIVSMLCDFGDTYGEKFSLLSETDGDENTILHYAAKLAPPVQLDLVSGVALQIQRELQWYKGVESIMPKNDKFKRNKEGDTAQVVFTKEHKDLLNEGEVWMKDTSGSCMIVGALIATVAFAAAFTVPGGLINDMDSSNNGSPIFLGRVSFTVFVVADALALFSSITSVLMFLAIYTSRYSEMDFLLSLPQKLIIGLSTLFISMASILAAFGASLYIVVGEKFPQELIPIALLGCAPTALFVWLELPLFYEMLRSTYWVSLFRNHRYIDPRIEKNHNKKKENIVTRVRSFWSL
ncbi:hypothetical protein MKX03_037166 [Papaver bracteatum]|nr:hypothetical protein MKX03_037166 [Papaver bracteatum]